MSETCFLSQQMPMKKRQQNLYSQNCYNFSEQYPCMMENNNISNLETPTPTQDENILYVGQPLKTQYIQQDNRVHYFTNEFQTLPFQHNSQYQQQEQSYQYASYKNQMLYSQQDCLKSEQYLIKDQGNDFYEHLKDSDQSTDAQIQSQQDFSHDQPKEKAKQITDQSNKITNLINHLYEGNEIVEDDILQLNDAERAIFYSIKNKISSQLEMTPLPQGDLQKPFQNEDLQDLLNLDQDIQENKNYINSFLVQNQSIDQFLPSQGSIDSSLSCQQQNSQKKQKKNNSSSNCSPSQNSQPNKKKAKRVEEMQKMIFKKSFKYVETSYFRERIKKTRISSKDKDYHKFYEFYFSQASKENKIPLKNFFHPQKQIKKGEKTKEDTPGQKSFNQAYISLILKSENFREKVEYYIQNLIQQQIQEERQSKISKVIANMKKKYIQIEKEIQSQSIRKTPDQKCQTPNLQKPISQDWESVQQGQFPHNSDEDAARLKSERFSRIVKKLEDYIQNNSKLKLPWTDSQIDQAILLARQSLIQLSAN